MKHQSRIENEIFDQAIISIQVAVKFIPSFFSTDKYFLFNDEKPWLSARKQKVETFAVSYKNNLRRMWIFVILVYVTDSFVYLFSQLWLLCYVFMQCFFCVFLLICPDLSQCAANEEAATGKNVKEGERLILFCYQPDSNRVLIWKYRALTTNYETFAAQDFSTMVLCFLRPTNHPVCSVDKRCLVIHKMDRFWEGEN